MAEVDNRIGVVATDLHQWSTTEQPNDPDSNCSRLWYLLEDFVDKYKVLG